MAKTEREVPPAMQALVTASKLNIADNTSAIFGCPRCSMEFTAYRTASGKLTGNCDNCGLTIPRM